MQPVLERIQDLLDRKGQSRNWLAKRIGKSPSVVGSWFTRNSPPKADDLASIADALDTSLDYLVRGEDTDWFLRDPVLKSIMEVLRPIDRDSRIEVRAIIKQYLSRHEDDTSKQQEAI